MCWNVNWTQPADGQNILRTANDIHVLTINMLKQPKCEQRTFLKLHSFMRLILRSFAKMILF